MIICGIMTGTSLDGVDTALVEFTDAAPVQFKLLAFETYPFPPEIKSGLQNIINCQSDIREISTLNVALSLLFADCVKRLALDCKFSIAKIDAVAIHGQTVWHDPNGEFSSMKIPSTYQLGSVSFLSALLNKTVVGDFRTADIAAGGQGAPLVPIFDYEFLRSEIEDIIALNIGGISNITLLPKNCDKNNVVAFDTGPGNVMIDFAVKQLFNKKYDEDGLIAFSGMIINNLLQELKSIPFITQKPPKSTGRELFNVNFIQNILDSYNSEKKEDIITTLSWFTAWSIAENIRNYGHNYYYSFENSKIIVSGGGSKNKYLMNILRTELPKSKIITSDQIGISSDAKEAICFAYLGFRTLMGLPGNIPSVTGASKEMVLGVISSVNYKQK